MAINIFWTIAIPVGLFVLSGLKIVKEYERGVKFTLGKFSGIMKPGLKLVIPVYQSWQKVDLRTKAVDVPDQDCITKDNVSVRVNAVLYFKISDATKAILQIENTSPILIQNLQILATAHAVSSKARIQSLPPRS